MELDAAVGRSNPAHAEGETGAHGAGQVGTSHHYSGTENLRSYNSTDFKIGFCRHQLLLTSLDQDTSHLATVPHLLNLASLSSEDSTPKNLTNKLTK